MTQQPPNGGEQDDDTDPRVSERPDPNPNHGGLTAEKVEALTPMEVA